MRTKNPTEPKASIPPVFDWWWSDFFDSINSASQIYIQLTRGQRQKPL